MSTMATTAKNASIDAIVGLADLGSTYDYPFISFLTSEDVELARCDLTGTTAFGDASDGSADANTVSDDEDCDAGTVAKVRLCDQDGTWFLEGDISQTPGAADWLLLSLTLGEGDTLGVTTCAVGYA